MAREYLIFTSPSNHSSFQYYTPSLHPLDLRIWWRHWLERQYLNLPDEEALLVHELVVICLVV